MEILLKTCPTCKIEKDLFDFARTHRTRDTFQSQCKICHRAGTLKSRLKHPETHKAQKKRDRDSYRRRHPEKIKAQKRRAAERARELVASLKGTECTQCRETFEDTKRLHFHHLDPATKEFNLGTVGRRTKAKILPEVAKCVVLCDNCHIEAHHPEVYGNKGV